MKRILMLLALMLCMLPNMAGTARAEVTASGTCGDNLTWTLEDKVLTISGTGEMANYTSSSGAPWKSYTITSVILEEGVTSVGNYAFYRQEAIVSADFPDTLTRIGDDAFYQAGLTSLVIPDSVTELGMGAFGYCPITTATIPGRIQEVPANLFYHSSLVSVVLEPGITKIQNEAFAYCSSLEEVTLPEGLTHINYGAFYVNYALSSIDIPDSVTHLGTYAFRACPFVSVDLPASLSQLDLTAFMDCDSLTEFTIEPENEHYSSQNGYLLDDRGTVLMRCPNGKTDISDLPSGVTRLGNRSLSNCNMFTEIVIPNHITYIDGQAFSACSKLVSIYIPDSVTEIAGNAFYSCNKLETVRLPQYIPEIASTLFGSCSALKEVIIPEGVTRIGSYAFSSCKNLTSVVIPDSVTTIEENAFFNCEALEKLELPASLQYIGRRAFHRCLSIQEVTIPAGVTEIHEYSFYYDSNLKKIVFLGDAPQFVNDNNGKVTVAEAVFSNVTATVYYPEGNETWTEEVMQQYGGTLTWVAGDGTELEAPASDLSWSFENGVLTISGTGPMGDYTQTSMPWAAHQNEVTSIVINEGITSIGSWAFCRFGKAVSVSIPSTVTRIGAYAFFNADSLTSLSIPAGVTAIEGYAFSGCGGLTGLLLIPGNVESIGKYAFSECSGIENIRAEAGLLSIGEGAFSDCTALKIASLPGTVTEIGTFAFGDCTALQQISVDDSNTHYYSLDGVLFTEGATTLIQYPAGIGGVYQVPQQVTKVESHAFRGCGSIQEVRFTGDAPAFGQYAFYNTTATVLYPRTASNWTTDVKQQYGGTLSWASYIPEGTEANLLVLTDAPFTYYSEIIGGNASYTFSYDETWFFAETPGYNHELSRMSMCMALAAARTGPSSIEELFETLNLANTAEYFYPTPTTETIGYAIGSKDIISPSGEAVTLIAVAVRGGGYKDEWHNNMVIGNTSEHRGFSTAASKVADSVRAHIEKMGYNDNIRIWITGFSRAAAVSNLAAHQLAADGYYGRIPGLTDDSVMAYCFECPMGIQKDDPGYANNYGQIYNIVNPLDLVPMVAPEAWNFSRYGTTFLIPSNEVNYNGFASAFRKMEAEYARILATSGADVDVSEYTVYTKTQHTDLTDIVEALCSFIGSQTTYVAGYQDTIARIAQTCFGTSKDPSSFGEALVEGLPAYAVQHPVLAGKLVSNGADYLKAHRLELCLAWLNTLDGDSLTQTARTRYLTANCPVDVSVYDSAGTLVARIVNDDVQEIEGSTIGALLDENGQKIVILPADEEFQISITATADGTMSWQIEEYDLTAGETTRIINYYDIAIAQGDVLNGTAGTGVDTDAQYSLTAPDGETLNPSNELTAEEIVEHDVTVSSEGNGTVSGGGWFVTGEYAKVTSSPDEGEEFLGWYEGQTLVSSEAEYRFRVVEDRHLVAKFTETVPALSGVIRIAGADRIETSLMLAKQLQEVLGAEKFDAVVVASALNFPDALTGSYLASEKNAPILLTYPDAHEKIVAYIETSLKDGGTVYILGGESAVDKDFENLATAKGMKVQRVAGSDRFGTNLEILKTAGNYAGKPVLIATATGFADSLSASATGLPMLLVYGKLTDAQKAFLETTSKKFIIIGGDAAVSAALEAELDAIGDVERVAGENRYQTSVKVAEKFIQAPEAAVLAYARNFPDGLCGGPVAYALGAPLILTDNVDPSAADTYVRGISAGIVVGGTGLISDTAARAIFDLTADAPIQ